MAISKLSTSASLKQVMDKFEEISLQDFSSIDVITASKLPTNGKEGQLCIITNVKPSKIYFDYVTPKLSKSEIFIQYFTIDGYDTFTVKDNLSNINLKIRTIVQNKNGTNSNVEGYIYRENSWKPLIPPQIDIYKNGQTDTSTGAISVYNGINTTLSFDTKGYMTATATKPSKSSAPKEASGIIRHSELIDLTPFKRLFVDLTCTASIYTNVSKSASIQVYNQSGDVVSSYNLTYTKTNSNYSQETWKVKRNMYELDVSNINIPCYVGVKIYLYDDTYAIEHTNECLIYRMSLGGEILV